MTRVAWSDWSVFPLGAARLPHPAAVAVAQLGE